jgi:hypothetical protein
LSRVTSQRGAGPGFVDAAVQLGGIVSSFTLSKLAVLPPNPRKLRLKDNNAAMGLRIK